MSFFVTALQNNKGFHDVVYRLYPKPINLPGEGAGRRKTILAWVRHKDPGSSPDGATSVRAEGLRVMLT